MAATRTTRRTEPRRPAEERRAEDERQEWMRRSRKRILLVTLVPLLLLVGSLFVSGYLQLERHSVYLREAERNYYRNITLADTRGQILDRNGALLASSVDMDTVVADPKFANSKKFQKDPEMVAYPRETARLVAEALGMDIEDVYERITRDKRFVYIKRRISRAESRRMRALNRRGIYLTRESKRFYPKKELSGQLLGLVGRNGRPEGIERAFDSELKGETKRIPVLRDTHGGTTFHEPLQEIPRFAGNSVVLSIDEKIQAQTERILEHAVITTRALSGMALVMDVRTGEVLAMANVPRFNPNNYGRYGWERRRNRVVMDVFEPGSTFKIFTLAGALDLGVVTLEDVLDVEDGSYRVGTHIIHDTHPRRLQSVRDIVKHSSNIGFAKMGELMGRDLLYGYLTDFGFGRRPGTGLAVEAMGILSTPEHWAPVTFANICFGQGVSTSAIQLVRAMAAVANGGRLMRPILVREIRDSTGAVVERVEPTVEKQVVSPETAALVMEALGTVVEEDGTGHGAFSTRYAMVGKTGTAQKPDRLVGGYSPDAWIGSFLGAAPAEAPRIAALVMIDEPIGKAYGGLVAAPPFREITEWTLDYLGVPPTNGAAPRATNVTDVETAEATLRALTESEHAEANNALGRALAGAEDDETHVFVPNFRGMSMIRVAELARALHLTVHFEGHGVAVAQTAPPGERVPVWAALSVQFAPSATQEESAPPAR